MEQQNQSSQDTIPFEFTGTALQFFGIWLVNILLIIITLGIYFPWAKVRTQRYFHNNTQLNDTPFDYLASPNAILKGWAIALVILMAYNILVGIFPLASLLFLPLILLATPWILVRSLRFRMRNTAYQNVHFGFSNAYRQAAIVFVGWLLLAILTLGVLYPRFIFEANRFVVSNTGYGTTRFRFHATAGDYYKIFLKASLILLVPLALVGILAFPQIKQGFEQLAAGQEAAQQQEESPGEAPEVEEYVEEEYVEEEEVVDEPSMESEFNETGEIPVEEIPLELTPLEPPLVMEDSIDSESTVTTTIEEEAPETTMPDAAPEVEESATEESETEDTGFVKIFAFLGFFILFAYMVLLVYIGARTTNLTYNSTEIAGHRFLSTVRARDLGWLYFSNLVAIAVSFGLLIPWTRIRMARYRADKLQLIPNGSLDHFMQAEADKVNALGEEIGEAFDIDFAL